MSSKIHCGEKRIGVVAHFKKCNLKFFENIVRKRLPDGFYDQSEKRRGRRLFSTCVGKK